MSVFKRATVVMLPTNEKAILVLDILTMKNVGDHKVLVFTKDTIKCTKDTFGFNTKLEYNNLYILSDEEIKEGDWFIVNETVKQCTGIESGDICWGRLPYRKEACKKIIATTDISLTQIVDIIDPSGATKGEVNLPQPSEQFLKVFVEEYNKGNQITSVLVEYEKVAVTSYGVSTGEPDIDEKLKVNPKDNTITIRRIHDLDNKLNNFKNIESLTTRDFEILEKFVNFAKK